MYIELFTRVTICVYIYVYVCMHACMHVCMYACVPIEMYTRIQACKMLQEHARKKTVHAFISASDQDFMAPKPFHGTSSNQLLLSVFLTFLRDSHLETHFSI